jgi:hypothetical protein
VSTVAEKQKGEVERVVIDAPKFGVVEVKIVGVSPYVQNKFSAKARQQMMDKQRLGDQAKKSRKREAKNFEQTYKDAMHLSRDGWHGIPAASIRNALISACRVVGFKMTIGKLSLFIEADGLDPDGTPLVKLIGKPRVHEGYVRNETGVADVRWRPMWEQWSAVIRMRYDANQFSASDVVNLLHRAGMQVGIGEGRPDSKNSAGLGWGMFTIDIEGTNK